MKLPHPELTLAEQLAEFDVWITPSLGEIRDTERFAEEMEIVAKSFEVMSVATNEFDDVESCHPQNIADLFVRLVDEGTDEEADELLSGLASTLFLVTGKSDNNAKCQFPIFLRDHGGWDGYPTTRSQRGVKSLSTSPIPRTLKSERVMRSVVGLREFPQEQRKLLAEFIAFVLSEDADVGQLWSIGRSFNAMKQFSRERELLTPLIVFQVRGSVSASGGHGPEETLRERLQEWGLRSGIDYNLADVVVTEENTTGRRKKTRAYDFVLPYKTEGWEPRVFIQCQFYAGDSGSVSHKNVDQTSSSRLAVGKTHSEPKFVEYVDGAGYFSSLNGDLTSLLSMESTSSFIQIRSMPVRLRRAFQQVGFLLPLEVAHAAMRSNSASETETLLATEGYDQAEIQRGIAIAIETGYLQETGGALHVEESHRSLVRRYFLLDVVAQEGAKMGDSKADLTGCLAIPGYGPFFGMKTDEVVRKASELCPEILSDWSEPHLPFEDVRWLVENGYAMSS